MLQFIVGTEQTACAVCKYWNDITNSAIKPKMRNVWLYDESVKKECLRTGREIKANMRCLHFECKLPKI